MKIDESYNRWASEYDDMPNKTRDLEAKAKMSILNGRFDHILELGCGTGKNTTWLTGLTNHLTAVDFSKEMINIAREKVKLPHINFFCKDITGSWDFVNEPCDLVTCSLILEHISDLEHLFKQVVNVLSPGGLFYIGELHPFKQYMGSKARFEADGQLLELDCYVHHISEFYQTAEKCGLQCIQLQEWWDEDEKTDNPRILTMLFQKQDT